MEKFPSRPRGKLIDDMRAAKAAKERAEEGTRLRGTLAPTHGSPTGVAAEPEIPSPSSDTLRLRGTLAPKPAEPEVIKPKIEGVTVSKEFLPNVEALSSLVGRTIIQRDGGLKAVIKQIRQPPVMAEDGTVIRYRSPVVNIHRSDNARISIPPEMLFDALTTKGGAWRLIEE